MVKWFLFLVLATTRLLAQASISVVVPQEGVVSQSPMKLTVLVTHAAKDKVDAASFQMGNMKVSAKLIDEEAVSTNPSKVLSRYVLDLPKMDPGLQSLPALSVSVGESKIKSNAASIQVREAAPDEISSFIKLEPLFSGTSPLYPGQRAWIGYRIEFNRSIDLTEEVLPLLTTEGFKRLGEKQVIDKQEGDSSVRQILQKIEASSIGKFQIPASKVSGYSYLEGFDGKKQYLQPLLSATADAFSLEVVDFPAAGKPASFRGAVGNFSIAAALLSPSTVMRGDPIKMRITLSGSGEFETLQLPDLCCQPGFSGYFKESDLPPLIELGENKKSFVLELYPQTSFIQHIPSIEFSFFDPVKKTYGSVETDLIPLNVTAPLPQLSADKTEQRTNSQSADLEKPILLPSLSRLELPLIYWDGWNILFILPVTAFLAWFLFLLREWKKRVTSFDYFRQAKRERSREKALHYLEIALKMRFRGEPDGDRYLEKVEKERFSKEKTLDLKELFEETGRVWDQK